MNIDNVEERKIHDHFNFVTQKLEKLHKNVMWNMYIGRSYLDKVSEQSKLCAKTLQKRSICGGAEATTCKILATWLV